MVKAGDIPCKGNGMTLGLQNSAQTFGMIGMTSGGLGQENVAYGTNISNSATGVNGNIGHIGITTDQTKSGIIADTSSLTFVCNGIIKY